VTQADWILLRTMLLHISTQNDFLAKTLLKVRFDQCGATDDHLGDIDQAIMLNKLTNDVFGVTFDKEEPGGE